jgi:nucleoid-associated protein YgaU
MLTGPAVRSDADADQGTGRYSGPVAVLAGDSLWDIVADQLGPGASDVDIALEWPRWYEANKTLLGQNPDVLLPGQILVPPTPA